MSPILVVSRQGEFKLQRTEKGFQQSGLIIVSRILFFFIFKFQKWSKSIAICTKFSTKLR